MKNTILALTYWLRFTSKLDTEKPLEVCLQEALAQISQERPVEVLASGLDFGELLAELEQRKDVPFDLESLGYWKMSKTLRFTSQYSAPDWKVQHSISGGPLQRTPNMQNFPINSAHAGLPHSLGSLLRGTAEPRDDAEGPFQPGAGDRSDHQRGGVLLGVGQALHQAVERACRKPDAGHRGEGPDSDGAGRGLRVVGAEQDPVPVEGRPPGTVEE